MFIFKEFYFFLHQEEVIKFNRLIKAFYFLSKANENNEK